MEAKQASKNLHSNSKTHKGQELALVPWGSGKGSGQGELVESTALFAEHCKPENAIALAMQRPALVDSLFQLSWKGKMGPSKRRNHLTPRGQLVAAIRRMTSQSAANAFGSAVLADLGGKQVNQSERIFGACLVASFATFHKCMENELVENWKRNRQFGIATHAYSSWSLLDLWCCFFLKSCPRKC